MDEEKIVLLLKVIADSLHTIALFIFGATLLLAVITGLYASQVILQLLG